ncbi:MAG: RNA-binding S4 domain-containing protein [Prevotella sp.]|nr:RNA-binding S4 domain-containing protein [Prevotella sp.]
MPQLKTLPEARLDKWLWAARIFKTRTVAANACKNGRVSRKNVCLKPSSTVKAGDIIDVKKPPVTYSFKIISCIEQRIGAKLVEQVYENVTDPRQYELLDMARISGFVNRARGTGRPTKKERRALDTFAEPITFGFSDNDDYDEFDFDE